MHTLGSNVRCVYVNIVRGLDVPAFFSIKGLIVTDGNKSSVAGILVNQLGLSIGTGLNYL